MGAVIQIVLKESIPFLFTSLATSLMLLLAMPGHFGVWPFLFVALVPLLSFVTQKEPRASFLAGLVTGFVYHAGMLYWIVIVLGRYGGLPTILSVPAMLLLSLYMAMYTGIFAYLLSYSLQNKREVDRIHATLVIIAPSLWVGLDWLRGILFSGFPWMDLGYGLFSQPVLLQIADLGGHHMVTFSVIMVNTLIFIAVKGIRQGKLVITGRAERMFVGLALAFLLLVGGYSVFRHHHLIRLSEMSPVLNVALVQGNIAQDLKWDPDSKKRTLEKYQDLSEDVAAGNSTLVVWPETALPFFPVKEPLFSKVQIWAKSRDLWLLTGAPYYELNGNLNQPFKSSVKYFNSAFLIDPSGDVVSRYDKQHLVPFGEYVPLRKYLPFLEPLVESVGNFSFGLSGAPLTMGDVKLGLLICYESIFPDLARESVASGADVLVNITNDAWYGRSSAPYQSFSMAVLRAVETRRSLIRAANTGVSGFIDPVGRVIEDSLIFETLSLSANVPIVEGKTLFVRFGYFFGPVCLFIFLLILIVHRRRV